MSELRRPPGDNGTRESSEEEQVRRLLELAGRRPEPPAEDLAQITAAARAVWQERLGRRRPRRVRRTDRRVLALAAALLAVVGIGWWWWSWRVGGTAPRPVASVETLSGAAAMRSPGDSSAGPPQPISVGETILAGAWLETASEDPAAGPTALRLTSGPSLRIDDGSRVRLVSATVVELQRGAVYVDSGVAPGRGAAVEVRTAAGVTRDVGTQFEVRLLAADEEALRVRVREGVVVVERGATSYRAQDGDELTLDADGSVARRRVRAYGPEWEWILNAAPPLDIEGRTLREFLAWVGRETGWEIRFADPAAEAAAEEIILHGTMGDVTPEQAPGVVLPGAGLSSQLVDGTLVVASPASGPGS